MCLRRGKPATKSRRVAAEERGATTLASTKPEPSSKTVDSMWRSRTKPRCCPATVLRDVAELLVGRQHQQLRRRMHHRQRPRSAARTATIASSCISALGLGVQCVKDSPMAFELRPPPDGPQPPMCPAWPAKHCTCGVWQPVRAPEDVCCRSHCRLQRLLRRLDRVAGKISSTATSPSSMPASAKTGHNASTARRLWRRHLSVRLPKCADTSPPPDQHKIWAKPDRREPEI